MYNSFTHCLFAASTKLYGPSFKLHNSPISRLGKIEGLRTRVVYPTIKCGEWPEMPKKWKKNGIPLYQSAQISKLLKWFSYYATAEEQ